MEGRLSALERQPSGLTDAPDSHLPVIVDKAGFKACKVTTLRRIQQAIDDAGIYVYPRLDEPGIGRETRIYFSHSADTFRGLAAPRLLFGSESQLKEFVVKNFSALDAFKGLDLRAEEYRVAPPKGLRVDILAVDRGSRELVAIELKHAAPDRGLVQQMSEYLTALRQLATSEGRPGARGIVVTGHLDRPVKASLDDLMAKRGFRVDWLLYRVNLQIGSTFQ
jgi:hypothetical protein